MRIVCFLEVNLPTIKKINFYPPMRQVFQGQHSNMKVPTVLQIEQYQIDLIIFLVRPTHPPPDYLSKFIDYTVS